VLKKALAPGEIDKLSEKQTTKEKKAEERRQWMHLLNVGKISETSEKYQKLSKSEQRQREASAKERKYRINNPNFAIDPLRLSIRNLPRSVDVAKLRAAVEQNLRKVLGGATKKERRKASEAAIQKVSLVLDKDRKTEEGQRRSKGFGFVAFKDHQSAMKTLEFLNDNSSVFGGSKRPIVEFAVEDKRKLRMQQELYQKHAHKLKPELKDADGMAKGKGRGKGAKGGEQGNSAKGDGKGFKMKRKKKEGMSRGRRQREKRREKKAAAEQKAKQQEAFQVKKAKIDDRRAAERQAERMLQKKNKVRQRDIPDAGLESSRRAKKRKVGHLSDDFELQAMRGFRKGH